MNYLKYTQYAYLLFGIYFIYDGIMKYPSNENYIISLLIAGLAIFMFIFRKKNVKKFEERNKNQ